MPIPLRALIKRQTLVSILNFLKSIRNSVAYFLGMDSVENDDRSSSSDVPPFDPLAPAVPVSFPIKTLEDLESRSYFDSFHFQFNKASVKLQAGDVQLPERERILVCHDMAGGYSDDKWVQGGTNTDAYAIWHWYLIDVFVYFSHSLVTLPPPCWTNTAHRHGVKVLGTFITEWDEGKVIANKLLSTKESAQMYAERLAELAFALGFDGWLINMEIQLDEAQIPNLEEFVSHLTQTMHSMVPGSLVIWYDSVTIKGDLNWQDQLNDMNKPFFDICDGIFVNYTWKEDYPKLSAAAAGDRKLDVYMGVDVFGRNTYGGGQWTTNVALDVIKKENVSAAIFAPGWVYETKQPPDFQTAQNRWWGLVEKSWGIVQNYPKVLPFFSNFDQGHGYHISIDGEQVSTVPWNNISSQSFQPFLEFSEDTRPDSVQVFVDFKEDSYSGGGNVVFKGTLEDGDSFAARLFQGELLLGDSPLHFIYSVKSNGNSLLGLSLDFSSSTNEKKTVLLASSGNQLLTMNRFSAKFNTIIMPNWVTKSKSDPNWVIQESTISMNRYKLTKIQGLCYNFNTRTNISSSYYAVLGHLQVKASTQNPVFPPSNSWLIEGEFTKLTPDSHGSIALSIKLFWKLNDGSSSIFSNYNIYVEKIEGGYDFLGSAQVEAFYVYDLLIPSGVSALKFVVQVCTIDGSFQKLEDSPYFQLHVQGLIGSSRCRPPLKCHTVSASVFVF